MEIFCYPYSSTAGKMYGNVEAHIENKPVRVITSGCNTTVENLSNFVENDLFGLASELLSQIKDTCHILEVIDDINH